MLFLGKRETRPLMHQISWKCTPNRYACMYGLPPYVAYSSLAKKQQQLQTCSDPSSFVNIIHSIAGAISLNNILYHNHCYLILHHLTIALSLQELRFIATSMESIAIPMSGKIPWCLTLTDFYLRMPLEDPIMLSSPLQQDRGKCKPKPHW